MFSLLSGVYESYFAAQQLNLLVVGAQGVGKTTILERLKVTEFSKVKTRVNVVERPQTLPIKEFLGKDAEDMEISAIGSKALSQEPIEVPQKRPSSTNAPRRRLWVCPAPERYRNTDADDDQERVVVYTPQAVTAPPVPPKEASATRSSTHGSMESVELGNSNLPPPQQETAIGHDDDDQKQYDLRPKAKMLPLERIRPTIGMNLGKVDICGALCNVWDLGGRLMDLWERYYTDCDAILFVWKVESDNEQDQDDDSSDDNPPVITPARQLRLLEQVRSAIPDDVPFLILGHLHRSIPNCKTGIPYSTAQLLPHYHNPCQALFFANARTGKGIRAAMEWLIPLAKRQQRVRERPPTDVEKE